MNVMATTLPRKSRKRHRRAVLRCQRKVRRRPDRRQALVVLARHAHVPRPAISASSSKMHDAGHAAHRLHLALELVEKTPVRAFGDDLVAGST